MPQWEYRKIDLNNVPAKCSEIDSLDDAGKTAGSWSASPPTICLLEAPLDDPNAAPPPRAKQPVRRKAATSTVGR